MTQELNQLQRLKLSRIRLVVFDVDGVLTDGRLHYSPEGETIKVFHVRDGVGIKILVDAGIEVAVVSAKRSSMLTQRMTELGVKHFFPDTRDKRQQVEALASGLGIEASETAFVGDDMVDLHAMAWCGLGLAPADAYPFVHERADIRLTVAGGAGVARHVADLILDAQGKYEAAYRTAALPEFERKR